MIAIKTFFFLPAFFPLLTSHRTKFDGVDAALVTLGNLGGKEVMKLGYISFRLVRVSLWLMCIIIFLDLFKDFSYCSQFCCIVLPLSHILTYHTQNTNFTKTPLLSWQ